MTSAGLDQPLFTPDEQTALRDALVCFLSKQGCVCCKAILPYQPFLLDAWQAFPSFTSDIDSDLPSLLSEGVPTGIISPIVPSKVWENASDFDGDVDCLFILHHGRVLLTTCHWLEA